MSNMAAQEIIDSPPFGPVDDSNSPSEEKLALIDFAYRLGAYNVNHHNGSSGILVDEEGNTRQEAKLLMSLLASPLRLDDEDELEPVSASESERSFASESSSSQSRRDIFSFTCPSLSLENSKRLESLSSSSSSRAIDRHGSTLPNSSSSAAISSSASSLPATLLGRPLKLDDRDALRLSADAMARNVSQSFQKAMEWRIQAWVSTLVATLLKKKQSLVDEKGIHEESELEQHLLATSEACLILQLQAAAEAIKVTATATRFDVGPLSTLRGQEGEPATKKQRLDDDQQPTDLEEGDYVYKVSHELTMECLVSLHTPAGFSEVTMQVPGVIEGTFLSTETGMEELRSVNIELDTSILAAMVEKGCRTVVRASVEALAFSSMERPAVPENATERSTVIDAASPTPFSNVPTVSEADVRAALVTPRAMFSDGSNSTSYISTFQSPQPMLRPIPDEFDDKYSGPRRISPQLQVSTPMDSSSYHHHHQLLPRTPKTQSYPPPSLVSPPPNEASTQYKDVPSNGPSLPILVEVACRVLHK